ncbi:C-GCAxxG-C-C family (seleno)protein [Anaeromyxobacter sp. Red801]|uniref:C-GCAxxG-C-C family (seleno)protein n=1 Tax=Anaeromyxobacter sp. Red801 TaxID=3411632 RepID=UPI003BA05FFF
MEKENLGRRQVLAVIGGALALGGLQACGDDSNDSANDQQPEQPPAGPQVADYPYDQHIAATYQLDAAKVRELAYQAYYNGGCCHGAFSGLIDHLSATVGQPFNLIPRTFGQFGAGGIAGYGSICGSILGGILIINSIVSKADVRTNMLTDLMRWYEREAFPKYVPVTIAPNEAGKTTLDFTNVAALQVVPGSHLCHASVSTWCAANAVSTKSADKLARCSRLTADVAGKVAEMLNAYLSTGTYAGPAAIDDTSAGCLGCHGPATTFEPVASGMSCTSCHSDKTTGHP